MYMFLNVDNIQRFNFKNGNNNSQKIRVQIALHEQLCPVKQYTFLLHQVILWLKDRSSIFKGKILI